MNNIMQSQNEITYLTRYAGSGIINTIIGFIIIFSAMLIGFSPVTSNFMGYFVGFFLGFILSKKVVFISNGNYVIESFRYLAAFIISFLFNLLILQILLTFDMIVILAQLLAAVGYTSLMYLLTRLFVFRKAIDSQKEN